jgi:tRNA threonylcarbamoyladenosine biosynthesis protein TsaE
MNARTIYLPNSESTRQLGVQLGRSLPPSTVLLLEGNLGSGKTTLVQGIGAGLGIKDAIDSPTFTLINEYYSGRVPLYHFDLYRLEPSQAATLYPEMYWEGLEVEPGIVAIEWSERLPYKPESYLELRLSHQEDGRQAELQTIGSAVLSELRLASIADLKIDLS